MHIPAALFALLFAACGSGNKSDQSDTSDSGDSATNGGGNQNTPVVPDCSWFTEDNCWKQTVRAVDDCLPASRSGAFATDYQTCDFDDGSRLTLSASAAFASPFEWSSMDLKGFELRDASGQACVTYLAEDQENSTQWTIGTSDGETRYTVGDLQALGGLLTCPDGTVFDLGDDMFSCPDANTYWPFISHSATGSFLNYSLQGGDEPVEVFTCSTAR